MADLDLLAIKTRLQAASSGPWRLQGERPAAQHVGGTLWAGPVQIILAGGRATPLEKANAAFVAGARSDVPALIAEVERLRAELAELKGGAT